MKQAFFIVFIASLVLGCRSQYEKMVTAKSNAVDEMYQSTQVALEALKTERQYINKDTIIGIKLLDIDYDENETNVSAIDYSTVYHYKLLLEEYPFSILKITGHASEKEKLASNLGKIAGQRAKNIQTILVKGFSIPEKRVLVTTKSNNNCTCAKVKLIQPHLSFTTQLELLVEKGDSLALPLSFNTDGNIESNNPHLTILSDFLKKNTDKKFQVDVHTDAQGADETNLKISKQNAKSLAGYLINQGANAQNLEATGHGETQPINHCINGVPCSDEEYQANRRVILKRL